MFALNAMQNLLHTQPFMPFRLTVSDGGSVDVRSPEQVVAMRNDAVVGLLDPMASDNAYDRHTAVWYMHVTRTEMLGAGPPPFAAPPATGTGTPQPTAG